MAKIDPILIKDFSGGWITEIKSDALKPSQSPSLQQADFSIGGTVKKDTGWSELGSDDEASVVNSDLFVVPDRQGIEWLLKKCGTKLKVYDDVNGVYSVVKTSLTLGDRLGHEYFDTTVYFLSKEDTHFTLNLTLITRLNGAILDGATTITVDKTAAFPSSGTVYINDVLVTYTNKTATEFTGCSDAVATPDNYLAMGETTDQTAMSAIVKGNISAFFAGRLWIASGTTSVVYASKLTDYTNFTVAGSGAGDAISLTIESKVNALKAFYNDANELVLMAFAANNNIYAIGVTDDATLGTIVPKQIFKESVTALNQFGTVVGFNDLYHVDLDNQIKTLGQSYASQGVNKVYSDNISENHTTLFKNEYNFEESRGVIFNNEYWNVCREGDGAYNNRAIIFGLKTKSWRRRTDMNANDIKVYKNQIIFSDVSTNKVYVMDGSTDINGFGIRFKYSTLDMDEYPLRFERIRSVRVSGFISSNCKTTVRIYKDFGTTLLGTFILDGSNTDITGAILDSKATFGSMLFGEEVSGGEGTDINYRFFIAQLGLDLLPDLENVRIEFTNNDKNVYFEITGIKPFMHPQEEHYFPEAYIINED